MSATTVFLFTVTRTARQSTAVLEYDYDHENAKNESAVISKQQQQQQQDLDPYTLQKIQSRVSAYRSTVACKKDAYRRGLDFPNPDAPRGGV